MEKMKRELNEAIESVANRLTKETLSCDVFEDEKEACMYEVLSNRCINSLEEDDLVISIGDRQSVILSTAIYLKLSYGVLNKLGLLIRKGVA